MPTVNAGIGKADLREAARKEAIEKIKIFREFARYYFTVRSNITYFNIIAAGAFTYFFVKPFVDPSDKQPPDYIVYLTKNYWLYAMGCIAYIGVSIWAAALCNLMSNSFYGYMSLSLSEEVRLGVNYSKASREWAATFEFLKGPVQRRGPALQGNPWNSLNAFLTFGAMFALILISAMTMTEPVSGPELVLYTVTIFVAYCTLFFILAMSMKYWRTVWVLWLIAVSASMFLLFDEWGSSTIYWATCVAIMPIFVIGVQVTRSSEWQLKDVEIPRLGDAAAIQPNRIGFRLP